MSADDEYPQPMYGECPPGVVPAPDTTPGPLVPAGPTPDGGWAPERLPVLRRMRRDALVEGDMVRSSHGYDLLLTEVSRPGTKTVYLRGHLHLDPTAPERSEIYDASVLIDYLGRRP